MRVAYFDIMSIRSRFVSSLRSVANAVERDNTGDKVRQWVYDARVKAAGVIEPSTPKVIKGGAEVSGL